jgi:hypothetical protein
MIYLLIAVLIIWPVFFYLSFYFLNLVGLSYHEYPFSNIGAIPKIGKYFNLLLTVLGCFQLYLFYYFLQNNTLQFNIIGILGLTFLVTTTITGVLTGLINQRMNIKVHNLFAATGFTACIPGWILFGGQLFNIYTVRSLILLSWGLIVMPFVALFFYKSNKISAKLEIFMFLGAFITDLILISIL